MQKLVDELHQHINFKDTTTIGDIVVIAAKEPQMLMYAYVTDIEADTSRKDEWWNIHLSVLSIPIQEMTWTLRTPQMTGMEIFTMGGEERFVKAVDFKNQPSSQPQKEKKGTAQIKQLKRVK